MRIWVGGHGSSIQTTIEETELAVFPLKEAKSSPEDLKTRATTSRPSLFVRLSTTFPEKSMIVIVFISDEYAINYES